MGERRFKYHMLNGEKEVALLVFSVSGARVDPETVQVGHTSQTVALVERDDNSESWRFDGPYRTWGPGDVLSFEGLSLSDEVKVTIGDFVWNLGVCNDE